jgi:hypothetical protein
LHNFSPALNANDATPSNDGSRIQLQDGWVVDETGNLIIWVPDEYRNSLWWPGMQMLVGGREPSITIDFKDARIGKEWMKIGAAGAET